MNKVCIYVNIFILVLFFYIQYYFIFVPRSQNLNCAL
jgi:hypothetical protein